MMSLMNIPMPTLIVMRIHTKICMAMNMHIHMNTLITMNTRMTMNSHIPMAITLMKQGNMRITAWQM